MAGGFYYVVPVNEAGPKGSRNIHPVQRSNARVRVQTTEPPGIDSLLTVIRPHNAGRLNDG